MRSIVYFDAASIRVAAESGNVPRMRRALASAQRHAGDFRSLVPWPALAASFDADVALLERALEGQREAAP